MNEIPLCGSLSRSLSRARSLSHNLTGKEFQFKLYGNEVYYTA